MIFNALYKKTPLAGITLILSLAACAPYQESDNAAQNNDIADESSMAAQPIEALPAADLTNLEAPYNQADFANGKSKYNQCIACHAIQEGRNGLGPHLHGILGRKVAVVEGYQYSDALKNSDIIWDAATLDSWIENSAKLVPGTRMNYAGMRDINDRRDIIAYLMVETAK